MLATSTEIERGAEAGGDLRRATWLVPTARPLDQGGPTNPFDPPDPEFVERTLLENFQTVAERFATSIAVDDGASQITYGELLKRSEQLACRLVTVSESGPIGILTHHSVSFVVAALGCLAAGRPYIALDLRYPRSRNEAIISQAGLSAIIVDDLQEASELALARSTTKIALGAPDEEGAAAALSQVQRPGLPLDDPAIILYTSGSSGSPKGIVNSQRAVLQRVYQHIVSCHIGPEDVVLPLSSFCTIAGTREAFVALLSGAKLVLADPERIGLRAVRRTIRERRATIIYSVPALIRAIVELDRSSDDFGSIRVVRLGGDKVLWSDVDLLRDALPENASIQIGYSSTETTGTQWFVPRDFVRTGACAPVGFALPGIEYAILDEDGSSVPAGSSGELTIRSPYVAVGGWARGRCVPGAVRTDVTEPDRRILATGDLVRADKDGLIEVVGRKDRQIKINGIRIEPAELEGLLRRCPKVADAAVLVRGSLTRTDLVAFAVPRNPGADEDLSNELRALIRTSLPAALHPRRLHVVNRIARLPSAKMDAAGLEREDDARQTCAAGESAGAATALRRTQEAVDRAWKNVLGARSLAPERAWDEAGGDSLGLLRLVFELEESLGVELPLERLRMNMKPAEFAAVIEQVSSDSGSNKAPADVERPTVFLFPGLTGDSPGLASLRAELERDLHFVTMAYPAWREMLAQDLTLADLAAQATERVLLEARQTIHLVGYSLGGAVAYEVAALLRQRGRSVGLLTVLDTDISAATRDPLTVSKGLRIARDLLRGRDSLQQRACQWLSLWLMRTPQKGLLRHLARSDFAGLPGSMRFALDRELCEALQREAFETWIEGLAGRTPLPMTIKLLRSQERRPDVAQDMGWMRLAGAVEVTHVPGDHRSMLREPHRPMLTERMREVALSIS